MTFEEFKQEYKADEAFRGWITVREAKRRAIIPDLPGYEAFKEQCTCGSDIIIKSSKTQMMCCNPECPEKIPYRLAKMFRNFNIKNIGPGICKKVWTELNRLSNDRESRGEEPLFHFGTYLEVLTIPFKEYPMSLNNLHGYDFAEACQTILDANVTFSEFIGKLGLTGIDTAAAEVFKDYSNYEQIISDMEKSDLITWCVQHGIYAPSKMYEIRSALKHILFAYIIKQGSFRAVSIQTIPVCMTGNVVFRGKRMTKAEFLDMCTETACVDGIQIYEFKMNSAVNSNEFVLYSTPSSSSKFRIASSRGSVSGEFGEHPVLMQVEDFYELVLRRLEEWKQLISSQTT